MDLALGRRRDRESVIGLELKMLQTRISSVSAVYCCACLSQLIQLASASSRSTLTFAHVNVTSNSAPLRFNTTSLPFFFFLPYHGLGFAGVAEDVIAGQALQDLGRGPPRRSERLVADVAPVLVIPSGHGQFVTLWAQPLFYLFSCFYCLFVYIIFIYFYVHFA